MLGRSQMSENFGLLGCDIKLGLSHIKEGQRLRVSENRVLGNIFEPRKKK
jgi:hypothetical protein